MISSFWNPSVGGVKNLGNYFFNVPVLSEVEGKDLIKNHESLENLVLKRSR